MNNNFTSPLVIPVFIPHSGCPHCCVFCNQALITGSKTPLPGPEDIDRIIGQYLPYKGKRTRVELAFFGGNFLGLSPGKITELLEMARFYVDRGQIQGIRFSTRPDTVTPGNLDLIRDHDISLVELGVQSMDDTVLKLAGRGHTSDQTRKALSLLKGCGIPWGIQVMVGLPGETRENLVLGARELAAFRPDTARIYPLLVLKGSPLAGWYAKGAYCPLTLDQAVERAKGIYLAFIREGVKVIRMGLQASEMMADDSLVLAGPWHPAFGHLVLSSVFYDRAVAKIEGEQAKNNGGQIILRVHPRSESRLRGDKNRNLRLLGERFPGLTFRVEAREDLSEDEMEIG